MKIDFLARHPHYIDHAAPVWFELPESMRGVFQVPDHLKSYLRSHGIEPGKHFDLSRPCVFMSRGEFINLVGRQSLIFLAHGAEQMYDGVPQITNVSACKLILTNPSSVVAMQNANPQARVVAVGCTKLDERLSWSLPENQKPVVAFSHHWDQGAHPETSSAFPWSKGLIQTVVSSGKYTVIGHKHPADQRTIEEWYALVGVPFVPTFDEVLRRADLYICDNSSTLYEFAATGRPVVVLCPPQYRRNVNHGLRFWDHVPGVECSNPKHILACVEEALADLPERKRLRELAVYAAYGELDGMAAKRAAAEIVSMFGSPEQQKEIGDTIMPDYDTDVTQTDNGVQPLDPEQDVPQTPEPLGVADDDS